MELWSDDDMTTEELTPREVKQIAADVRKIKNTLFGNGTPGMDELMRNLEKKVDSIRDDFATFKQDQAERKIARDKKEEDDKTWRKRFFITTATPYVVSFVIWIIYWFVKLQPLLEKLQEQTK